MANIGFGSNSKLWLNYETTPGTIVASGAKQFAFYSESIRGSKSLIQNELLGGDPNPRDPVQARSDVAGDLALNVGNNTIAWLAKWITGNYSVSGAGPYVHTSKLSAGSLQYASAEILLDLDTDLYKRALGLCADTVSFEIGPDGFFRTTVGVSGMTCTKQTTAGFTTPTDWSTETPYHHGLLAAADTKYGGSANTRIASLSLNIGLNLNKDIYGVGQGSNRLALGRGRATIGGTLRVYVDEPSFWDDSTAFTNKSIDLTWTISASEKFQLVLPRMFLQRSDPVVSGDGPLMAEFAIMASKDSGEATALKFVTTNSIVTYA